MRSPHANASRPSEEANVRSREWRDFATRDGSRIDGREILEAALARSEWGSAMNALAALTVFVHPDVVRALGDSPVFRTVRMRSSEKKGDIVKVEGYGDVLADDNQTPQIAFKLVTGIPRCRDMSVSHVYAASRDPSLYTNPKNIFVAPAFLAKLTDSQVQDPKVAMLRNPYLAAIWYRAYELYDWAHPAGFVPVKPAGYPERWAEPVGAGTTFQALCAQCRTHLTTSSGKQRQNRATASVIQLGWGWNCQ